MNGYNWQPIETAPKDGTSVLVGWEGKSKMMIAHWDKDTYEGKRRPTKPYWWSWDASLTATISRANPPTHWMKLPSSPGVRS